VLDAVVGSLMEAEEVRTPSSQRPQSGERELGGVAGGVIPTPQAKASPPQGEERGARRGRGKYEV
jgi:hypothetical protein